MKLRLKDKLTSGALQFTLFIAVIIALLLAAVILLAYTHGFFIEQSKAIVENVQLADTGIAALANESMITPDTLNLPLKNSAEGQSVKIHLSHWGIFEKAFAEATQRKKKFIKMSLLGTSIPATERPAIYLRETHTPLAVVGSTRIKGNVFISQQGIRSGNIAGNSYYGQQLLYGDIKQSEAALPHLKYDYLKELGYYLYTFEPVSSEGSIPISPGSRIVNSFAKPVKGYFSEEVIVLDNVSLSGNIILRSAKKIIVKKNAVLKDIILAAPVIEVQDGFNGSLQAIADTTIKIGKACLLFYSSALILLEKEETLVPAKPGEFDNKILVGKGSEVRGSICYFKPLTKAPDYMVNVFMDMQTFVKGEIYCEGNLELRGNVAGTIYTNQFLTNEAGSIFVNHLYNVVIESDKLPEAFGGILFETGEKSVMKWLY